MSNKSSETQIQKAILEYLWFNRILAWRNNTGGMTDKRGHFYRFGKKGSGDIFCVLPGGKFVSIEVKSAKGRVRESQKEFMKEVNEQGALAFVARSIDDVREKLEI